MKYFIGIDGGGTKTNIVLTDKDLEIYDQDSSGPSHYLVEGKEKSATVITELIIQIMRNSGIRSSEINSVCAGIAGTGREADRKDLKTEIENLMNDKGIFINSLVIDTDAKASLLGAHSGKAGCTLIAGTGSVLYGQTPDGKFFRCGGFGKVVGDEGSGFNIGRKGLALLGKSIDGRGSASILTKLLAEEYKISTEDDLIDGIYKSQIDIASAAKVVIKAAGQKDKSAIEILTFESEELIRNVAAASSRFNNKELMLSLTGGLLENENLYSSMVKEKINKNFPNVKIKDYDYPPAIGAILLSGLKK